MYCSKCGTQRADDAKFCAGCGTKFDEVMNVQPESEQETAEEIQGTETLENSDASRSESESLSAEDDVADEGAMEDVEPDDQEMPIPAENDVADEGAMEDVEPDDQEVSAQAESGDSVKAGTDGSSWIEESNYAARNKGISKPMLIGGSVVIVAVTLILVISSLGDQDGGISKEELVQQIRNGDHSGYYTDFTGVDLSGADLSGLQNMELYGTDFTGADLSSTDFTNSDLGYSTFTDASLDNVKFVNTNLEGSSFSGNYSGVHIRDSNLKSVSFSGELEYFTFENVDLSWASFYGIYFGNSIRFIDSTLYGTDIACFKIEGDVRFFGNHLEYMELNTYYQEWACSINNGNPDWSNTVFRDNTFDQVSLEYGQYNDATFLCNTFTNSNLANTDFTYAKFETRTAKHNLNTMAFQGWEQCEQTFTDSNMGNSDFWNFDNGTSFIRSTLASSSINSVHEEVTWYDTICPDETNSDDNENTCENNL